MKTGIFIGLITLDCIYQTRKSLAPNEKQVAETMVLAAGGPATNAAIAFQALGGHALLVGALGQHPLTAVIREDLNRYGVTLIDLTPNATSPPPFSSIVVNVKTGDRAVISRNAADRPPVHASLLPDLIAQADCVLIDGHHMPLGHQWAQAARAQGVPVIIDAGSWKPHFETVLSASDVVIASANFAPPQWGPGAAAIAYLQQALHVPCIAVTQGPEPILYQCFNQSGTLSVPSVDVTDTLAAGDILHGAFSYFYTQSSDFVWALEQAAAVATNACQFFGPRQWISALPR
jgi:sugar/nucleoside kinase (ribokinase family)